MRFILTETRSLRALTDDLGAITPATYPFDAPYRSVAGNPWSARIARMMMCLFSTLANTDNDAWDARSGTLTFTPSAFGLRSRLGFHDAGSERRRFRMALDWLCDHGCTTADGKTVKAVERRTSRPGGRLAGSTLTFTPQFAGMLAGGVRYFSIPAFAPACEKAPLMDLMAVGILYCPANRILRIPVSLLPVVIPALQGHALRRDVLSERVETLNGLQDGWRFAFCDGMLSIRESSTRADAGGVRVSAA